MAAMPSGRVRLAFYERGKADQKPDYEVGMRYWANGVADDLQMDFTDFVMRGKLTDFERQAIWHEPALLVGKIVEIHALASSTHGKLREPRFIRVRHDKQEPDA